MFRSISSLASQFIIVPRYINLLTCRRDSPFTVRLQVGMLVSCFFVTTIVSVFLAFNFIPYILLFLLTVCIKYCNFFSESANKTVLSEYLKGFMLYPPILMSSSPSMCLKIISLRNGKWHIQKYLLLYMRV